MNKLKILIVEDETIVALDIKNALTQLDYHVTNIAINYDDAIQSVKEDEPNIILMDISLSESKDGIETAIAIQKIKNIPILYLTAFSDDDTIDRAVKTNPIGYLIKPFKREELKSTIHLGLYKLEQSNNEKINHEYKHIGDNYYYDLKAKKLYYKQKYIKLGDKESLLLNLLITNPSENYIPFSDLECQIWPNELVSNSALRTLLYRLRTKMNPDLIESVPYLGCKMKKEL